MMVKPPNQTPSRPNVTELDVEPAEGLRLMKAFRMVSDPATREAIITLVERIAAARSAD
jgi:hypothetical protein